MTNKAIANIGFEVSEDDFATESTSIYNKATAFIAAQSDGSTRSFEARTNEDGTFIHLVLTIVVVDMEEATSRRDAIYNAITALDDDNNPVFPPLIETGNKGWHFVYDEDGLPIVIT